MVTAVCGCASSRSTAKKSAPSSPRTEQSLSWLATGGSCEMAIEARRLSWLILIAALCGAPALGQAPPAPLPAAATSAQQMTVAARALLAALDPAQLDVTLFALDAEERSHWSNVPY